MAEGGDDWDFDEIKRNTRGANSYWYWKDRAVMDEGIAKDVLAALKLPFEQLRSRHREDPPDCEAIVDGWRTGIEVTELAHESTLKSTIKGNARFLLWDQSTLCAKLQALIERKDTPEKVKDGPYDRYFLIIHTDECSLGKENVEGFLRGATFQSRLITHAYLALPPLFDVLPVVDLKLIPRR
jgi:hypothetical protein